jgi:hypothetical protein
MATARNGHVATLEELMKKETMAGNLDAAVAIRTEIQRLKNDSTSGTRPAKTNPAAARDKEKTLRALTGKIWFVGNARDHQRPHRYLPNGETAWLMPDGTTTPGAKWQLEPRWVIRSSEGQLLLLIDEQTVRGFHTESGTGIHASSEPEK